MKKLLTILCICIASICLSTTRAVEPQNLLTLSSSLYYALDGDKRYLATMEEIRVNETSSDALITIYNTDFSIKEQFTIKGAFSYVIKTNDNGTKSKDWTSEVLSIYFDLSETGIIASRGLFTKDGSWVIFKRVRDADYKYLGDWEGQLYSSNNKKVCSLKEYGLTGYGTIGLSEITTGTPFYYSGYTDEQGCRRTTIWSFEDVNGVVTPKAVASNVKAYPNPLPSGTPLSLELDREADSNTILTITDLDGRQVYRERVRPGKANVQVSPKFSRGLHIYTVIYSDGESFSGKVAAE